MRTRMYALIAIALLATMAGVAVQANPASADTVEQCGTDYVPYSSQVTTERYGSSFSVTYGFKLSAVEQATLQCLEDWLEIEMPIQGFDLPNWWDEYSVSSDLPSYDHDIDASDTTPSPAATGIWTGDILPETRYTVTISWTASIPDPVIPQVTVRWVPAHWSFVHRPVEAAACSVGVYADNPGWCIFGTDGLDTDMVERTYGTVLPFNHGFNTYQLDLGVPSSLDSTA